MYSTVYIHTFYGNPIRRGIISYITASQVCTVLHILYRRRYTGSSGFTRFVLCSDYIDIRPLCLAHPPRANKAH